MNTGLIKLTSHRQWIVPNFVVWGLPGLGEIEYLNIEDVGGTKSVAYGSVSIGNTAQPVQFDGLIDLRGNNLPSSITRPFVTARSQSARQVFVVGKESNTGFTIARDPGAVGPVIVELVIIELGE